MFQLITVFVVAGLLAESHQQSVNMSEPCLQDINTRCWTQWFDRDDPSGTGDWETLTNLRDEFPNKICPTPLGMEVETTSGVTMSATGEVIAVADTTTGFVCKREDQPDKTCLDYRVRFGCHPPFCDTPVCWTQWYDRDNPSGTGDWEILSELRKKYPDICATPVYVEAVTADTLTPALAAGQNIFIFNPSSGFVCRNEDQVNKALCRDYQVRFACPC